MILNSDWMGHWADNRNAVLQSMNFGMGLWGWNGGARVQRQ